MQYQAPLAEEHGNELVPAAKIAGVAFALVATDDLCKHRPGNLLEKLAENAGYLRQGWGPRGAGVDSYGKRLPTRPGARPSARHANLDASAFEYNASWLFAKATYGADGKLIDENIVREFCSCGLGRSCRYE